MPNLQMELQHLALADVHIAEAEDRVIRMEGTLSREKLAGSDTSTSEAALDAVRNGLVQFRLDRQLILSTIDDIEAGRLPST